MDLKTRMKELRAIRNIKQTELAAMLNVSQGTIANWESGKRSPDCDMIIKLASVLSVSVDYLLGKDKKQDDTVQILQDKEKPPDSQLTEKQAEAIKRMKELSPEELEKAEQFVQFLISQRCNDTFD